MPVKNAIFPPGMQNALIWFDPMRLISHCHLVACGLKRAAFAMIRLPIARRRTSCGWSSGASARLAAAWRSRAVYCWAAACSSRSAGTRRRSAEGLPTSTPSVLPAGWAAAVVASATSARGRSACGRIQDTYDPFQGRAVDHNRRERPGRTRLRSARAGRGRALQRAEQRGREPDHRNDRAEQDGGARDAHGRALENTGGAEMPGEAAERSFDDADRLVGHRDSINCGLVVWHLFLLGFVANRNQLAQA